MAAVTNAAATVSSTSLVGLLLLSECVWPTRVTPLLSHVGSLYGAVYAVVVLLSMTTGVLYQVRTLYPIVIRDAPSSDFRYTLSNNLPCRTPR